MKVKDLIIVILLILLAISVVASINYYNKFKHCDAELEAEHKKARERVVLPDLEKKTRFQHLLSNLFWDQALKNNARFEQKRIEEEDGYKNYPCLLKFCLSKETYIGGELEKHYQSTFLITNSSLDLIKKRVGNLFSKAKENITVELYLRKGSRISLIYQPPDFKPNIQLKDIEQKAHSLEHKIGSFETEKIDEGNLPKELAEYIPEQSPTELCSKCHSQDKTYEDTVTGYFVTRFEIDKEECGDLCNIIKQELNKDVKRHKNGIEFNGILRLEDKEQLEKKYPNYCKIIAEIFRRTNISVLEKMKIVCPVNTNGILFAIIMEENTRIN